jgi:hypothetical protein
LELVAHNTPHRMQELQVLRPVSFLVEDDTFELHVLLVFDEIFKLFRVE